MILRIGLLYLTSSWDLRASFQALKQYLIMVFYCKKLIWIPFSNYFLFYLIIHSCKTSKTVKFTGENAFFNWCKAERSQKIFTLWKKNQNTRISTFCLLLYARLLIEPMAGGRNTKSILAVAIKRFKTSQSVVFAFLQQHRRRLLLIHTYFFASPGEAYSVKCNFNNNNT